MTETPTKIVVDCSTGETTTVPLTPEEIAEQQAIAAQEAQARAEAEAEAAAKAAAKQSAEAKLKALGLSDAEIAAIIGA